jgi:hypothetical protein
VAGSSRVRPRPITDADVPAVAEFLHHHMDSRVSADEWAGVLRTSWSADAPNHGFFFAVSESGGRERVVGAHAAIYSDREINGQTVKICNLAAWSVIEEYRFTGMRLLQALLKQEGYTFTDMSPSGNVPALLERLGFQHLDTSTAVVPNLPWPSVPRRVNVTSNRDAIAAALDGADLKTFRDHEHALGARPLLIQSGGERCLVFWRRDRRWWRIPLSTIIYASNPALFRRCRGVVARHLLLRHGVPITLAELRVTGPRPKLSMMLGSPVAKMFKSDTLAPNDVDYLYSELTALP